MLNRFYTVLVYRKVLYLAISASVFANSVKISGVVNNQENKPIKKALVTIRSLKDEIYMETKTSRKGEFKFPDVKPKFYFLVVEHETYGSRRIKLNPRKNRNNDLNLFLQLNGEEHKVECYLYDTKPPTEYDPILNVKNFNVTSNPEKIILEWKDNKQAVMYKLYENDIELYTGEDTRFEKPVNPGAEFCYTVKAVGNYGLEGKISSKKCISAKTQSPRDVKIDVYKNTFSLSWSNVDGALSYNLYRDDIMIGNVSENKYKDLDVDFDKEYFYKITALDKLNIESDPSIEIKARSHKLIEPPILSSIKSENSKTLIWNNVEGAVIYNIYREGEKVASTDQNSFVDNILPGKKYCYEITAVDSYEIESAISNKHCTKVSIATPKGLQADADVSSIKLYWDNVAGAIYYNVYERVNQDSIVSIGKTNLNHFIIKSLEFSANVCYVVTAVDSENDESKYSISACNRVFDPPHFTIQSYRILEPSGNRILDAQESGAIQFAIFNDGQSPAHNVIVSVLPKVPNPDLIVGQPIILDTLEAGRIKFVKIDIKAMLRVADGDNEFELNITSREKIKLDTPFIFNVESKAMLPSKMIIADFAISNEFNTRYIPKNEKVTLTIRIQNVGEGETEFVDVTIKENRTFTTPGFTGNITLPAFKMGDYMDIELPVMTSQDHFSIDVKLIDYLGKTSEKRINLQTMRNYRSPLELTIQDIGTDNIEYYPDEIGEVDVDRHIPLSRKNPNGIAIVFGIEDYKDQRYPKLEYAKRDRDIMRKYFSQAFGFSDFQMLPSKPWQMEGGPSEEEYQIIFDPHEGDLRKRIISAEKYSNMEAIDIFLYYRGYGEWINGRPLLIPKDAKYDHNATKYPLEEMLRNLSKLSVLSTIKSITIFLDISYTNPEKSAGLSWDFPELPEKISILSASSNGETSQTYKDKKHSYFTYALLKALAGGADDGNNIITLGEITEYVYRSIPQYLNETPGSIKQNAEFVGSDLKRTIIDLR